MKKHTKHISYKLYLPNATYNIPVKNIFKKAGNKYVLCVSSIKAVKNRFYTHCMYFLCNKIY